MSLRFLLGFLASGLPDPNKQNTSEEINVFRNEDEDFGNILINFQAPAKFHIGMLTISLIVGIAYGGYTAYTCWLEKNIFLGYIRNLVIALVFRTFFSIVFDGAILLGSPLNIGGGNSLLSFEQICLNLVIAFWLTLNIYLHERVQSNFNHEPTLIIYQFGVPVVTLLFAFIWIFTLQSEWSNIVWWMFLNPFTQWIVNSINLLYLLIQLVLLGIIARAMIKITLDNDSVSLLRKISAMMGVFVLIFWLQFGLSIGRVPLRTPESYLYFYYLIDGLECALICLVLFFFNKWVLMFLNKVSSLMPRIQGPSRTPKPNEILLAGGRGVVTIDSVFMTRESGRWKRSEIEEGNKDVVYSNIIEPERLKKTLDLYKRLNIIPTMQGTAVEEEEFYDCQLQNSFASEELDNRELSIKKFGNSTSDVSKNKSLFENRDLKSKKVSEKKQKNAFYSSKYLILDTKETDIPKFLETRPSVASTFGKDSIKERMNKEFTSDVNTFMTDELVRKWLNDNSEIMPTREKITAHQSVSKERKSKTSKGKDSSSEIMRHELILETAESISRKNVTQTSSHQPVLSANNSVLSRFIFGSNNNEEKGSPKEVSNSIAGFTKKDNSKAFKSDKTVDPEKKIINNHIFDKTEKKSISTPEPYEIKKDFDNTLHESEMKIKNNKPQDAVKKEFKSRELQVNGNQRLQMDGSKPENIRVKKVVQSEYSRDSNCALNPVLQEHENTWTLTATDTEVQQKQNQMKHDARSLKEENLSFLILNNESLKPAHSELLKYCPLSKKPVKEPTNGNENQTDTKPDDDIKNKSQTSYNPSEKLKLLESKVEGKEGAQKTENSLTARESTLDSKYEPQTSVLDNKDFSIKELKKNVSLSDTVDGTENTRMFTDKDDEESKPTLEIKKPLNQYITYSDLVKFRSQREKSFDQPTGVSKKLFDFAEVLSSTIGYWLSAGSNFFILGKNSKCRETVREE